MARQWILTGQEGFETSLKYEENIPVPSAEKLGPNEVLVKLHAASLNYRELPIAGPVGINGPITPPIVPACDGAGSVEGVGSSVKNFRRGDSVVTHLAPKLVDSSGDDAYSTIADVPAMLGQGTDGTLRSIGIFPESALVHAPTSLEWLPAATLTCTWTTAWNTLFGLGGKTATPGSWVLVQGTGGVSIATLQLAVAAGANVVATTSSEEKAARLTKLGAKNVVNYLSSPDGWGREARALTPDGRGFDIVVDVGGNQTLSQSLTAVRVDGVVMVVGGVGEPAEPIPLFAALMHTCIIRGILGGSRNQFKELVRFIDEKNIKPAVDDVVFELADAKNAYRRLKEKKHFSKVVIQIDHPRA
ncbi:Fc.00g072800.m01.CDS01 [Cosmosporella sp. VM-42]